jgi:hypothetical protein
LVKRWRGPNTDWMKNAGTLFSDANGHDNALDKARECAMAVHQRTSESFPEGCLWKRFCRHKCAWVSASNGCVRTRSPPALKMRARGDHQLWVFVLLALYPTVWSRRSLCIVHRIHAGRGLAMLYCEHLRQRLSLDFARKMPLLSCAVGRRIVAVRKMALRIASNGFLMRETNVPQTGQMAGEGSRYFRRVKTGSFLDLALFLTVNCPAVGDSVNELV